MANLQGVRLAHAVWNWISLLTWSTDPQQETSSALRWGISWLELFFNFYVTTGYTRPIEVDGCSKFAKYLDYFSAEC